MDADGAMERLEDLRRDLVAFTESRMPTFNRLAEELEGSIEDLRRLLDRDRKSENSRKKLDPPTDITGNQPWTITIDGKPFSINNNFREAALAVADEVDLDELQATKRCLDALELYQDQESSSTSYRAIVRINDERYATLDCLRLLLSQTIGLDASDEPGAILQDTVYKVVRGQSGTPEAASAFFRKCLDGLTEVESYLTKNAAHKQTVIATGQPLDGEMAHFLATQRVLLAQQHECLAAILSHLIRSGNASREDFRPLLTKASQREELDDTTIHYLPIFTSGAAYFGADEATTLDAAKEIYGLLAPGATRLQWKLPMFRATATVCWLVEYSSRFQDPTSAQTIRVADRQREAEERQTLFFECVKDKAFHFLLLACQFLRPEVWFDPAKFGLVRWLMQDTPIMESSLASHDFASLVMTEMQAFSDAFVANMPDALRRLKADEDDLRRAHFSKPPDATEHDQLDLERFLVIMSYAYHDNPEAAQDFWSDKESNLYGFLRWTSRRLPTPRVAAFCELLRSIAGDEKSANQAHLFLREDTTMTGGRLRKSHSVSWTQIFSELEIYASTVKNKPAIAQQIPNPNNTLPEGSYDEPETYIMLEAYLRLASHLCRTSPDARNWILREQSVHIGETLFQLASTGNDSKIHAVCFNMLAALLTDKIPEVNEGMWVLLENWVSGSGSNLPRHGRTTHPEQRYLNNYIANPETAAGLVNFLNALVAPTTVSGDQPLGSLPFPESLGAQSRQGGVEVYVDFVLGPVFRSTSSDEVLLMDRDRLPIDVLRYACLEFVCICLSSFNEDLVALANATNLNVDATVRTSSLAAYMRLHPFARVMDWMFNNNVIHAFAHVVRQDIDLLNQQNPDSPRVQATLKAVQAMNLAMDLQATYFDIVRPLITKDPHNRSQSSANASLASYDEVILSQIDLVTDIVSFATSTNVDLSLESLSLLRKLCKSRKLSEPAPFSEGSNVRIGSRLVGRLSEASDAIAIQLQPFFAVMPIDLDAGEECPKLVQANAILDVLNSSLDNAAGHPTVAHCLLGFSCHQRTGKIEPASSFSQNMSLFHTIASCAVQAPFAIESNYASWLLKLKQGCMDVVLKLALSPLTAGAVIPSLRAMEFLPAMAQHQRPATPTALWDYKLIADAGLLLDSSATAVRAFFQLRENLFDFAALELRKVTDAQAFSVQEKVLGALQGRLTLPDGQQQPSMTVFDLFDFFDLETEPALVASCRYLKDIDFSSCLKEDLELVTAFDVAMAEQLLLLQKREMQLNGTIKEPAEDAQVDDEIRAICASLTSQNNWRAIQNARVSALEAWADLLSLIVTTAGLNTETTAIALQGLQIVLPRLERTLSESIDSAALLAKLTLTLVQATGTEPSQGLTLRSTGLVHERLMSAFRVCLKVITDSSTGLGLRDVCYRICCAVLVSLPLTATNGKISPSPNARQLLQLIQTSGDRLIIVITEDAFSGRGITRVSSLLFLDALIALFQLCSVDASMLRALEKLNFIPVLIDHSIGSVTSSFSGDNEELVTAVAYFHTALSLLLRICQTSEGTYLTLNSGFFPSVAESGLFSTDPDIGLDIDNPIALREFYKLLSAVLRVVTAIVLSRGAGNASVLQQAKAFLKENRFSMQAVFKRTSAVQKTAGPPEKEAVEVADEFARLLTVTGFLEVSASSLVDNTLCRADSVLAG
jgi:nuclear pore complex protein Nup205